MQQTNRGLFHAWLTECNEYVPPGDENGNPASWCLRHGNAWPWPCMWGQKTLEMAEEELWDGESR